MISPTQFIDRFVKKTETGQPLVLTPEERQILDLAFSLLAHWNLFIWSAVKKSGKTLFNALLFLWWAFTHPNDEILLLANDQEQSMGRVHKVAAGLIKHNPPLAAEARVLSSTIRFQNGTTSNALTNEATTAAGANQGLSSWDELWGFQSERGLRLWEELTPVPNKPSVRIVTTYAGWEGESKLLWDLYLLGVGKQEHKDGQAARVHKTLPIYLNRKSKILCYWDHLPRLSWQTREYYASQRRTLRPNTFLRLHENRWTSAESQFISAEQWDAIIDESLTPVLAGAQLFVGLDIGVKWDCSARVAVRWHEDGKRLVIASHRIWKPSKGQQVQLADVQDDLLELARLNTVAKLYADPNQAMQLLQNLQPVLGESVACEFAQSIPNTTRMGEALFSLVSNKNLISYRSPELKTHVTNAVGIETPRGVRMVKSTASKKIDAGIALAMACVAAIQAGPGGTLDDIATAGERAVSDYSWWREFGDSTSPGKFWDS